MQYVEYKPRPVDGFSLKFQELALFKDVEQLSEQLPLVPIIQARQRSRSERGDAYDTVVDHFLWDVIGDPYEPLGPQYTRTYPKIGTLIYRLRYFSGMSETGEILHVGGEVDSRWLQHPAGYVVDTCDIRAGERVTWFSHALEGGARAGEIDARLKVGRQALRLYRAGEEPGDALLSFRSPSNSDGAILEGERRTFYSRPLLKNTWKVLQTLEQTYVQVLPALYSTDVAIAARSPAAIMGR